MTIQGKRALRAIIAIGLLVVAGFALSFLSVFDASIQLGVRDRLDSWEDRVSETYALELFDANGYQDVCVSEDQQVVGFSTDMTAEETFSQISEILTSKGWRAVPSGSSVMASFEKEDGRYSWALVSCVQMSEGCSAVIQSMIAN